MAVKTTNNVLNITIPKKDVFKYWLLITKSISNLTDREIDVLACYLQHRYELSQSILDDNLLDKYLMVEETKRSIKKDCNISTQHINVILTKFRKNGIIRENKIAKSYIPNIPLDASNFVVLFNFKFKDESTSGDN